LCGVGTAIYYHGDTFWNNATKEMSEWLDKNKFKKVTDIVGLFHRK